MITIANCRTSKTRFFFFAVMVAITASPILAVSQDKIERNNKRIVDEDWWNKKVELTTNEFRELFPTTAPRISLSFFDSQKLNSVFASDLPQHYHLLSNWLKGNMSREISSNLRLVSLQLVISSSDLPAQMYETWDIGSLNLKGVTKEAGKVKKSYSFIGVKTAKSVIPSVLVVGVFVNSSGKAEIISRTFAYENETWFETGIKRKDSSNN